MNIKKKLILLLLTYSVSHYAVAEPQLITVFCPPAADVLTSKQTGSWAEYKYTAYTWINLPELGNQLEMMGEGNTAKATILHAATWTDRTFLCVYNVNFDVIVIFETKLDQYVKNCYFKNTPHRSECISSNPLLCPMTCELGKNDD